MAEQQVVTHIVRRFGLVGGMEAYVWHLCRGLSERGWVVNIICEQQSGTLPGVNVLQTPINRKNSRWQQMHAFRNEVYKLVDSRKDLGIIHSHERSIAHNVTTFHGQPFYRTRDAKKWWHCMSKRIEAWVKMEEHELCSESCQAIVPVSYLVKRNISELYPLVSAKLLDPIWPGVSYTDKFELIKIRRDGLSCVFVGVEWRRKGLEKAIEIVKLLRADSIDVTLSVYGPSAEKLPAWMQRVDWLLLEGFQAVVPYKEYDLLIHPAEYEAFGMVVSEARQQGVPVLMSDMVGALDLHRCHVRALSLNSSIETWCESARELLKEKSANQDICKDQIWDWSCVASSYERLVYSHLTTT